MQIFHHNSNLSQEQDPLIFSVAEPQASITAKYLDTEAVMENLT